MIFIATAAAALVLAAVTLPLEVYELDLLTHFAPHALVVGAFGAAVAAARRAPRALAAAAAVTLALLAVTLHRYGLLRGPGESPGETATVRVAVYNAFARGAERRGSELDDDFRDWLVAEGADLVCVVDPPWSIRKSGLWPGEPHLPHVVQRATPHGPFRITLLSRWPLRLEPLADKVRRGNRLSFAAHSSVIVEHPSGGEFLFTAAHPRSPRTERMWEISLRWTRVEARLIRDWAEKRDAPVIYAGDFNTTPTGRLHALIERVSGLRSPTRLFTQGTWPASVPTPLALPIDRVFVSPGVRVTRATVGPRVYSDHRPALFELEVPVVRPPTAPESEPDAAETQNPQ